MKRKLNLGEMNYLENHLFDQDLCQKFYLDKKAYEYIVRATKLPYNDILELSKLYLDNNEIYNGVTFINSISKKYNSNNMEVLQRIKEISAIEDFRKKQVNLKLVK